MLAASPWATPSSQAGSSCAPAAADSAPGAGSAAAQRDAPHGMSPPSPAASSAAPATWPLAHAPSSSAGKVKERSVSRASAYLGTSGSWGGQAVGRNQGRGYEVSV